ncbi:C40 family peptidase [[Mycobacterium] crassicus]|uniref:C40 family peptidase n=1 Tax=[Mycobacterium] crassicus TaxID=2872309 RepID=A0ABU5XNX5_9MYCO|nr:C40 family peptidase [Mycolicibacter sp. MYC098]MEB3023699.1 C40 family peptidase [Mycolicibacter sp. MYC098]
MFGLEALMALIHQVSGTPYITGGDSPAGTDCSGLASWVTNVATGRPAFGDRFHTANEESALLARGFKHGTAPGALVVGWNSYHTAVTLPDGTPVSSGESGGVKIGGGGAYQKQFTRHMYLPMPTEAPADQMPPMEAPIEFAALVEPAPAPEAEPMAVELVAAPMEAPPFEPPFEAPIDAPPAEAPPIDAAPLDAPPAEPGPEPADREAPAPA